MNWFKLRTPFSSKEETIFKSKLKIFFKNVDLVEECQKLNLNKNLHYLGFRFRNDLALAYYDRLIQNLKMAREITF